jgi:antitoxin Phd
MKNWQLQDAKARFSELVKYAIQHGPQQITVHGKPTVVILSQEEFENLKKPKKSFLMLLRQSPLMGVKLNIKRDRSSARDVDL